MSDVQVPRRAGSDRGKEAGEFPPGPILRTIQELEDTGLRVDWAQRVASARLVFANHESLQHDFPSLTDTALLRRDPALAGMSGSTRAMALRQVRESWLLAYAGLVSVAQTQSSCANTAIAVDGNVRQVWRPSRYGRALVTSASQPQDDGSHDPPCGLLDVKGAGVATGCTASLERHSSGLCSLGEVLREVLFQSLINEIFRRAATGFGTVPIYGVIDLGFDARTRSGQTLAAGLLVRRAHRRPPGGMDLPACGSIEEQTKLEIELLLRHYGLTSSNRGSRFRFESGTADLRIFYGGRQLPNLRTSTGR